MSIERQSYAVKVPILQAEYLLRQLRHEGLLSKDAKPKKTDGHLLIPLRIEPSLERKRELLRSFQNLSFEFGQFKVRASRPRDLADFLADKLPPNIIATLPRSYDVIGDIAIIEVPEELVPHEKQLAWAVKSSEKNVRLVVKKGSPVRNKFRVRDLDVLTGSGPPETVHREHGCVFKLDVTKVYFSPRLSYEHSRVASLVKEGERVLDMFAGVGGFSVLIAKKARPERVDAVDINPEAFRYLKENILLNRVAVKVHAFLGDVRDFVAKQALGRADRVIMNLPAEASTFVDIACRALRAEGGVIHYYTFASLPDPVESAKNEVAELVTMAGSRAKIAGARLVKETGPYAYQVVVDLEVGR